MGLGTGRKRRDEFLEQLRKEDPVLAEELDELRKYNPQKFRRRLAKLAGNKGKTVPVRGRGAVPGPHPGREMSDEYRAALAKKQE